MKVTQAQLRKRVEHWRVVVCPEWEVVLMRQPSDPEDGGPDGMLGSCAPNSPYRSVKLWINRQAIDSERELDETIVHELVHCLLEPLCEVLDDCATDLGAAVALQISHRKKAALEPACEQLCRVVLAVADGPRPSTNWNARGH